MSDPVSSTDYPGIVQTVEQCYQVQNWEYKTNKVSDGLFIISSQQEGVKRITFVISADPSILNEEYINRFENHANNAGFDEKAIVTRGKVSHDMKRTIEKSDFLLLKPDLTGESNHLAYTSWVTRRHVISGIGAGIIFGSGYYIFGNKIDINNTAEDGSSTLTETDNNSSYETYNGLDIIEDTQIEVQGDSEDTSVENVRLYGGVTNDGGEGLIVLGRLQNSKNKEVSVMTSEVILYTSSGNEIRTFYTPDENGRVIASSDSQQEFEHHFTAWDSVQWDIVGRARVIFRTSLLSK